MLIRKVNIILASIKLNKQYKLCLTLLLFVIIYIIYTLTSKDLKNNFNEEVRFARLFKQFELAKFKVNKKLTFQENLDQKCTKKTFLENCPEIPLNEKKRIIILSHQRTGSSITGYFLQQSFPAFYIFEPFRYLGNNYYLDQTDDQKTKDEAINVLTSLFNCKRLQDKINGQRIIAFPHKYQIIINKKGNIYKDLEGYCKRSKTLTYKLTRVDLNFLIELSTKMNSTFSTVMLFRDPRAIVNSRLSPKQAPFCVKSPICKDPKVICQRIRSNIKTLMDMDKIPSEILNNLVIIRYEDLALNTKSVVKQLYFRLGFDYTEEIDKLVDLKTRLTSKINNNEANNKTINVVPWIRTFENRKMDLDYVQSNCLDVMQMLGYNQITMKEINENKNIDYKSLVKNDYPLKKLFNKYIITTHE